MTREIGLNRKDLRPTAGGVGPPSDRARVRRLPERGIYEPSGVAEILRAGVVCHVGLIEAGSPVVVPTTYGLYDDSLMVHGLPVSRLLRRMRHGFPICVNVTLFDGLVLARSAFEHSMNYRSVTLFGRARWVRDLDSKREALRAISDHLLPGRWQDVRPPTEAELRRTHVLAMPLSEASAKVRSGPPTPDEDNWDTWTGVLPAMLTWGQALDERKTRADPPTYIALVEGSVIGGTR